MSDQYQMERLYHQNEFILTIKKQAQPEGQVIIEEKKQT